MGTLIAGLVEAQSWADEELWLPIINAGLILRQDYDAFSRLFGVRNTLNIQPIAASRGFPNNFSNEEIMRLYRSPKTPYLDGDINCYAPSWLSWREMQAIDWSLYDLDWQLLYKLMQSLAKYHDFSDLRLVVWFDN